MASDTLNKSLIGGTLERRLEKSKVPPLELPHVLAPVRRPGDDDKLVSFRSQRPFHVEIGFGRPHYLCEFGAAHPDVQLLGFEIKRKWCAMAAKRSDREELTNLRVIEGDARAYLTRWEDEACVDGFHILFPDPWWKKRHHKRRLFSKDFLDILTPLLVPGGTLVFRTDVAPYAEQVVETMFDYGGYRCEFVSVLESEPRSHREKKCASLGIPVFSHRFIKESPE